MQPGQDFKPAQKLVAGKSLEVCVKQVAVEGIGDVSPVYDFAEQESQILPRYAIANLVVVSCNVRTSIKITHAEWIHLVPACSWHSLSAILNILSKGHTNSQFVSGHREKERETHQ
jgi:hypothetical protein